MQKIKAAPFDEHLSVVSLLIGKLSEMFQKSFLCDAYVSKLYEYLLNYKKHQDTMRVEDIRHLAERDMEEQTQTELLTKRDGIVLKNVIAALERFTQLVSTKIEESMKPSAAEGQSAFEKVKQLFGQEVESRERTIEKTSEMLTNVFHFMEDSFGESQEMVVLITELNANFYAVWFIRENGCDQYYRYNKGLLFDERQQSIVREMDEVEDMLNRGIK